MTILISTHRLSLLSFVDRILLFERGKLIADGPRDKVIAMLRGGPKAAAEPLSEVKDVKGVKTVA
jgi:ATP-binding cassette subfamily C protein LapB